MKDSEIFIIGAKGQLGLALREQYPGAKWAGQDELDITDKASVEAVDWTGISVLLNAAAYTNVDGAETLEGRTAAWSVNAVAVANLVSVAAHYDMTIVHLSSDYVFDGTHESHLEDEAFAPLSVYAASKAAGDIAVSLAPKFYIMRTSWVIGEGKNFVRTMLGLAEKGINPMVVADQVGRITFTSALVEAIHHLLSTNAEFGTYNITNDGESVSWADIAREIFKEAGYENAVTDTTTAAYFAGKEGIAPRPPQSTLDLSKIKAAGYDPRDWKDDLKVYIKKEFAK